MVETAIVLLSLVYRSETLQKKRAYLDYNATAPIRPAVVERVVSVMAEVGNPSSVHESGRRSRAIVEQARAEIAALVNSRARDIVFTSGGTEANNTVLKGSGAAYLIISAVEHDCVFAAAESSGVSYAVCPVDGHGVLDLEALASLIDTAPVPAEQVLISIMAANNETGVVQPLQKVVAIAHEKGARVHSDAVQMAGKLPFDFAQLGLHYATLSAHKMGGPQGVGAIILQPTAPLKPLIAGGGQELGRRSGTENVAGIAGFGVAASEAASDIGHRADIADLRDRLEAGLRELDPNVQIFGQHAPRLPGTTCVRLTGIRGETQVMHMDLGGVAVSSGSACSSGKVKASHVLAAMGADEETAGQSIRISLGYASTAADVEQCLDAWAQLYKRSQR